MYMIHSVHYDTIATMQTNKMQTFLYNYNNILIYITPTCFGPRWPIIREITCVAGGLL